MAASPASASRKLPEPEINVTPLVDVVLVLLIIFMVVAPQLENGESVELPSVEKSDPKPRSKLDPVTVTMTASGALYLEKEPLEGLGALRDRLVLLRATDASRRVVLKGDASLRYIRLREAFKTCQDVGFSGVSLQVNERGGHAPGEG